jgi:hypothetical protein
MSEALRTTRHQAPDRSVSGRKTMIDRSKLALTAAVGTVNAASRACVASIRNLDSLLLMGVRRLYDAHNRRVLMRLAPTKWLD